MLELLKICTICLFVIGIIAISSCKSKSALKQSNSIEEQVLLVLDPPLTFSYNSDSTYVLCLGGGSSKSNPLSKSYCVFDNLANLVLAKKSIHGNVSWHDNTTIMLEEMPRVINKRETPQAVIKYLEIKEDNAKSK